MVRFKRGYDEHGAGPEEEQMPGWFHLAGNALLLCICLALVALIVFAIYAELHR